MIADGVLNMLKAENQYYDYVKANPSATQKEKSQALLKASSDNGLGYRAFSHLEKRLVLGV